MLNTDGAAARLKAEKFRQALEQLKWCFECKEISVTVSIGIAELNERMIDFESLLSAADRCLYSAKNAGRNCIWIEEKEKGN